MGIHGYFFNVFRRNPTIFQYLIIVDSMLRLQEVLDQLASDRVRFYPSALFIILFSDLEQEENDTSQILVEDAFSYAFETYKIFRMIFFIAADSGRYYGFAPSIFEESCGRARVREFGSCPSSSILEDVKKVMYPSIDPSCKFSLCLRRASPFVFDACTDGAEVDLVKLIQSKLSVRVSTFLAEAGSFMVKCN